MKYTLSLATFAALSASSPAALTIVSEIDDNGNNNGSNPIEFISVAVNAGDVVVVATSVNKNNTVVDFSLTTTAGGGDVSGNTNFNASGVHAAHISYLTVVNAGTYDFGVAPSTGNTFTSNSTLYVLRADTGIIALADTTTEANTGAPTVTSLDYTFASSLTSGSAVAIEALTSQSGVISLDSNYTLENSNGTNNRNTASSTAVNGLTWTANHTIAPVDDDFAGAGAAFSEVPEPSSSLLLLGSLSILFLRRL